MELHGVLADFQPLSDALVRQPLGHQTQHFQLARGQRFDQRLPRIAGRLDLTDQRRDEIGLNDCEMLGQRAQGHGDPLRAGIAPQHAARPAAHAARTCV